MALGPARLLVPARTVEPPLPLSLSSASFCSAAGGYTNFSLFSFHPPGLSNAFSISARVLEAQNNPSYRQNRHSQFRRQPGEPVPFDDLQTLYEEERGRLSYPIRNPNGNTHSTQRGGGNGGRRVWEPTNYPPWHSRGAAGGEAKTRNNKPWSSQSRYESSWASQTEDDVDETHGGRSHQTIRNGKPWSSESRYDSSWTPQTEDEVGETFRGRSQQTMGDRRRAKSGSGSGYRDGRGSVQRGNSYDEGGNPPWQRQGNFFRQDTQRGRQNTALQGREPSKHPWEGENRNGVTSRPQRQYNRDVGGEQRGSQWSSSSTSPSSMRSTTTRPQFSREFEEDAPNYRVRIGSKTRTPQIFKDTLLPDQSFYPVTPWQSNFVKESEVEEEEEENEDNEEEEGEYGNQRVEFEEEQHQNTDISPITRIMKRLRNVNDSIPALHARTGVGQSRGGLADSLALPSAREYLSDRSTPWSEESQKEESEKGELDTRFPWEVEAAEMREDPTVTMARRLKPLSAAELTLPAAELRRLRILSVHLKQRVKLGKHGVTNDLVSSIMQRFRTCEVVKVKCEGPPAGNMKKTLETLEQRTGGMIIWKAGSVAVIYRGKDFGQPVSEIVDDILAKKLERLMSSENQEVSSSAGLKNSSIEGGFLQKDNMHNSDVSGDDSTLSVRPDDASKQVISRRKSKTSGPEFDNIEEYAMEVEDILADLGPRYEEWIGPKPVPVDADLLPAIIPNYTPPYRLLPFGVRPKISNTLATHLRRLSRPLAPHFVTGRDRGLQGLAAAMVKLWEKSEIAKIGVKRGFLNTNQERLAEDLKQLTGGFFLCRDKKSMTFYRGKDFLPQAVAAALAERHAMAQNLLDEEERVRTDRSIKVQQRNGSYEGKPSWVHFMDPEEQLRLKKEAAKARRVQVVSHLERKLKMALRKKEKAGRELEKVEELIKPVGPSDDQEILTDEERFMLKKLGLKMKAFLLVGRRGVFSGVVQNMHLHWKHRELVKIIIKEKDPVQLKETATMLERESGGILISVDPTSKGYAIVVYRGKNYTRPPQLRPVNLLTKRLALKRSMEAQRRLSLSRHIQALEEEIVHLRAGLSKLASTETLERSKFHVVREECADVNGSQEHNGPSGNQSTDIESDTINNSILTTQEEAITIFAEEDFGEQSFSEDDEDNVISKISKRKLIRLSEMGPIFRAVQLTKTERHNFRNEVLGLSKAAQYLVGRSNPLSTIAKAIRLYFLDHAFIKIGIRNRPPGTSIQDIVEELEDLTGGTVYAQDEFKIILYRGWPSGENMPLDDLYDVLSLEQCDVLEEEEEEYGDDEDDNILNSGRMINDTMVEEAENDTDEDADVEDEDSMGSIVSQWDRLPDEEDGEEGNDGQMLDDSLVKSMENISDGEDTDDVQWETVSDEDEDDEDHEEGGDDVQWETVSDEDEDDEDGGDDVQWETVSDEDDEDGGDDVKWETVSDEDDKEGGDDDDSPQWDTWSDGSAEDDDDGEKGGDGVILDDTLVRDTENFCVEEKDGGADTEVQNYVTESSVGWDSFLVGIDEEGALDFDIDEDV